jgi:ABC-type oligopeptide transport system substrate-binding subunit
MKSIFSGRIATISVILLIVAINFKSSTNINTEITVPLRTLNFNTDPQTMEDVTSLLINRQLYRGLMKYTSELELTKDLAVSYEILDAGMTYRFTLGDFKFSDGSKITSFDVVATFQRMVNIKSSIAADLQSIVGFSADDIKLNKRVGVTAISDKVVDFKLKYADPFFIKNIAAVDCSILKIDNKMEKLAATSGRYSLVQSGIKSSLQLLYSEKLKSPHIVNFVKVDSEVIAIPLARQGSIDTLESFQVSKSERSELESQGWLSFKSQVAKLLLFSLNPKTLDLETRKIIFSIFNQRKNDNFNAEHYAPAFGLIPNLLPGHLSQQDTMLLSTNDTLSLKYKAVTIACPDVAEFLAVVDWAKNLLEQNGIKVKIVAFPISDYFQVIKLKKYEIVLRSKYLDYPDGMSLLTYFKHDLPINTFDAGNKNIDELIESAQLEVNNDKRISFYKKIQVELLKDYTLVPIFNGANQSSLWNAKKIHTIQAHPMGFHSIYFHEIEITE